MRTYILLSLGIVTLGIGLVLPAQGADPTDNRMRDALRNALLQARSCETEKATLEAAKSEADEVNKGLTAKVESLTSGKTKAEKAAAGQAEEITKLKDALGKWQAAYQQVTEIAKKTETERVKLSGKSILLQREVEDQQRKNDALFKTGNEILTRYEHFGLGDALAAKEPFVGLTRVKLQNLVQDYRDKLADQKVKP
ncbi:MAG: phage major capsid protein [Chthoniobacterales bacterium]|nr:phage major capsid protein [Chthoniobacterales bacterium]